MFRCCGGVSHLTECRLYFILELMILSTIETVPGHDVVETLGLVRGSTVRARNIASDWVASLRNIVGGEVVEYTRLQAQSREQALQRLVAEAENLKADAIIGLRMTTSMIVGGAAEMLIFGTAVKLSPKTR